VPVHGAAPDPRLLAVLRDGLDALEPAAWFDAHTHIGANDPDGLTATPEEILAGLDEAGQHRALLFPMHEPAGYREANDAVLAACAASDGRLAPLARVAPNAPGAVREARRALDAGARGLKLHPRSDAFGLPHPVVDELVALAAERRAPVLFHAGRGIPNLGEAAAALARAHPGVRIILAHAGISDLGLLAEAAGELPNLLFDTSWWNVADLLQLYATMPPGRILYASDMPYGPATIAAFNFSRCARAVGLDDDAQRAIAGAQLERVLAGEDLLDLGPAPGLGRAAERVLECERACTYLASALQMAFRGGEPTEALALAATAAQSTRRGAPHDVLDAVAGLIGLAQEALAASPGEPRALVLPAVAAMAVAGTSAAGPPATRV
jgi:uncharacterized protein